MVSTLIILVTMMGLVAMAILDLHSQYCPHALSFAVMCLGLAYDTLHPDKVTPIDALLGMLIGFVVFRLWAFGYERLRHREGLGQGDANMLAAGGAWLGWQALPCLVALAASSACLVGIALLARQTIERHTPIPFGPFLILAGLFMVWRIH